LDAVATNAKGEISMGVYIKGMKMPTKCIICPLEMYGYCLANDKKNVGKSVVDFVKDEDCPLIPIPPHGRLIDADALEVHDGWMNEDRERNVQQTHITFVYSNDIVNAPTIIEAEGEQT